ncbi:MAG TPA: ABC transporter ATP-binding protein [Candidatus Dormibacteraeota bacterium]|nr:ABC transporter ATP-binding protein [Candidatus Dormibacteraeota bacterium]
MDGLTVRYGQLQALTGVTFSVEAREAVAIIGANGAGKSTLLRTISGLHRSAAGAIRLDGRDITHWPAHERVRAGVVMVPEGRRLFPSLTLEENLVIGASRGRRGDWTLARIYELFPWMGPRRRLTTVFLSGGEQQSVAIGRALMANPRVLLLDELSLGLAPAVIQRLYALLPTLLESGLAVLLVEQDVSQALRASTHAHCLLEGRITLSGRPADLTPADVEAAYFGFARRAGGT